MNSYYQHINTSSRIPSYLQDSKKEDEDSKNMYYYGARRTTPTFDRCNTKRNNRVLLEDTHCHSDQRSDEHNSSSASFETLLPKNGFYDLDAFFDIDIISLDGSVLEEEQDFGENELKDCSPSSVYISRPNLAKPFKRYVSCEEMKEPSSSFSSQGKVLDTFAFDSLKRKAAAVAPEKKDEEASTVKKIKIRTSPIQAWKMECKESSTTKKLIERPCFISNEEKVQISDETKQHGTSLSNEIFQFYKVAKFRESDRGCKRDQLEIGYTGLACAYCDGSQGRKGGRYFPSSIKTIADPNKVLLSMHKHLQKCLDCPSSTKKHLTALHELYGKERATQARGSQRKFYKGIWDFLRKKDEASE
ncbi:hypothetical protein CTEN210_11767 [Chaetoceros tenuissimus]|uniref:Uncharacterized protein n=1 Tax=Chaetoceros tenuissimus TaxID=426638 RepID=A0AAD3H9L6_9STRA|nr:hypothetical protein CTEN210_11767 [Chaetoceros tenuissimus]